MNLLLRFRDAEGGRILIDGQDVSQVTQDSLRRSIGMVTQDSSLLHRSVRANILYGRPDATEAQMVEAARRAEADGFIRTLADSNPQRIILAVGPEGGWTDEELARANQIGAATIDLGRHVLRTDTAAVALAAIARTLAGK